VPGLTRARPPPARPPPGRAELPESLKALFRPITVVVPDRQLIMENMLMAEGFVEAKVLAKKFAALYFLLEDLLSPAKHYDWCGAHAGAVGAPASLMCVCVRA
jgi:hypothetical protein